jgi:transcriptional regulator with XRE-family HTH domain
MSGEGEFGVLLRAYRRPAGLSQQEVAERSGLGIRTVSNLERGRTRWPYPDSVHRLADALELSGAPRAEFLAAAGRRLARPAPPRATGTSGAAGPADPAGAPHAAGAADAVRPASAHAGGKRVVPGTCARRWPCPATPAT